MNIPNVYSMKKCELDLLLGFLFSSRRVVGLIISCSVCWIARSLKLEEAVVCTKGYFIPTCTDFPCLDHVLYHRDGAIESDVKCVRI